FTANAALEALLGDLPRDATALRAAFGESGGDLAALLAANQPFSGRLRLENAAGPGASHLLHADFAPLDGSDGLWLCTCVDLTGVERSAQRRATTLRHLQHTLHQAHDMMSLLDSTETLLFVNQAYAQFHGHVAEACVGRTVMQVLGPANHAWTKPYRERLFRTLQPVSYQGLVLDKLKNERVLDIFLWPLPGAQ